jgi:formate transporter
LSDLTWSDFLVGNLVPVTIGNLIGGPLMAAAVYRFVFLRAETEPSTVGALSARADDD